MSEPASSSIDKDARIAELEAALAARDTLIDTLRHQLAQLRRMTFGQSSEKLALQLALEELEGEAEVADSRTSERAPAERVPPMRGNQVFSDGRRLARHDLNVASHRLHGLDSFSLASIDSLAIPALHLGGRNKRLPLIRVPGLHHATASFPEARRADDMDRHALGHVSTGWQDAQDDPGRIYHSNIPANRPLPAAH